MNFIEFVDLVDAMRSRQRSWFKNHQPSDLDRSKALERDVDRAIQGIRAGPGLFEQQENGGLKNVKPGSPP